MCIRDRVCDLRNGAESQINMKDYQIIVEQYPAKISKEQFCKIAHLKKSTAAYYLLNGLVPCEIHNTSTHKYSIAISDVLIFLTDRVRHPQKYCIQKERAAASSWWMEDKVRAAMKTFYADHFSNMPDLVTCKQIYIMTGHDQKTAANWIHHCEVRSFKSGNTYRVVKADVIKYITSAEYLKRSNFPRQYFTNMRLFEERFIKNTEKESPPSTVSIKIR